MPTLNPATQIDGYKVSHPKPEPHILATSGDSKALLALDFYLRKQFKMMRLEIHPCEQGCYLLYRPFSVISEETLAKLDNRCTGFLAGWSAKEGAL
jgi:hypothetical protein